VAGELGVGDFVVVVRQGGSDLSGRPYISVRRDAFALSASLNKEAELMKFKCVTILVDNDDMRVAFRFHNDEEDLNSYNLGKDGGQHKRGRPRVGNSLSIQARRLINETPWLKHIALEKDAAVRRFVASWDGRLGLWVIACRPNFENRVLKIQDIPVQASGIYRYVKNEEVIYIGRGMIRQRAASPERSDWEFDRIEYSIVDGEKAQMYWEDWWIDWHEKRYGKKPFHNRVRGFRHRSDQ
jgi:hypothetical protein